MITSLLADRQRHAVLLQEEFCAEPFYVTAGVSGPTGFALPLGLVTLDMRRVLFVERVAIDAEVPVLAVGGAGLPPLNSLDDLTTALRREEREERHTEASGPRPPDAPVEVV